MTDEEVLFCKRAEELYLRSERGGIYTQTDFLDLNRQSLLNELMRNGKIRHAELTGGFDDAERKIAVFGREEELGYPFCPDIVFLQIAPVSEKFGEELSHRDILGALMSLGIKREKLGDILLQGKTAYLAASDSVATYICENLTKIRHTDITVKILPEKPESAQTPPEPTSLFVASERLDCLIAAVYHLSRSDAKALFAKEKVFVNARLTANPSTVLQERDLVSVRGMGRFRYLGIDKLTKKGRLCIRAEIY